MTGKTNKELSSVLPLDARIACIASGGGLAVSLRKSPAKGAEMRNGYRAGFEPDELDFIAPTVEVPVWILASLCPVRPSNPPTV